jgi:D-alanyl-D-alanine dipeptidase
MFLICWLCVPLLKEELPAVCLIRLLPVMYLPEPQQRRQWPEWRRLAAMQPHPVRNPNRDPSVVGNTPLARNVHSRGVAVAITAADRDPPEVVRSGTRYPLCVSWNGRGKCFEFCERAADHEELSEAEATDFHSWCEVNYA